MNTRAALGVAAALRGVRVLPAAAAAAWLPLQGEMAAARQRIARVEAERLALLDSVCEQAQRRGCEAGHARALADLAAFNARLQALAADHSAPLQALLLRALHRLLGELPADLLLAQLAGQALLAVRRDVATVQVCVHPQQRAAVQRRLDECASNAALSIEVMADARLAPTDCRIDTEAGSIDASLATQLAALAAALAAAQDDEHA